MEKEEDTPLSELTPEMQRASQQGWSMIKSIVFPALPAIAQDLWVYLELFISIVAFALGVLDTFPIESGQAYNYSYFGLATISMILALIDGFIYFFQYGSCARCIRDCRGNLEETQKGDQKKCCHLRKPRGALRSLAELTSEASPKSPPKLRRSPEAEGGTPEPRRTQLRSFAEVNSEASPKSPPKLRRSHLRSFAEVSEALKCPSRLL